MCYSEVKFHLNPFRSDCLTVEQTSVHTNLADLTWHSDELERVGEHWARIFITFFLSIQDTENRKKLVF